MHIKGGSSFTNNYNDFNPNEWKYDEVFGSFFVYNRITGERLSYEQYNYEVSKLQHSHNHSKYATLTAIEYKSEKTNNLLLLL